MSYFDNPLQNLHDLCLIVRIMLVYVLSIITVGYYSLVAPVTRQHITGKIRSVALKSLAQSRNYSP